MDPVSSKQSSALRCYYVAVSNYDAKMKTLVELLLALQTSSKLALAITCSSRDALDAVISALSTTTSFSIVAMHSDLTEAELEQQTQLMKTLTAAVYDQPSDPAPYAGPAGSSAAIGAAADSARQHQQEAAHNPSAINHLAPAQRPDQAEASISSAAAAAPPKPQCVVLVTTDVCLKAAPKELLPLGLPLLVQYDLPASKEVQQRRVSAVMGGSRERRGRSNVVIDFVVAGELPLFRAVEQFSTTHIQEMPVHVPDILA